MFTFQVKPTHIVPPLTEIKDYLATYPLNPSTIPDLTKEQTLEHKLDPSGYSPSLLFLPFNASDIDYALKYPNSDYKDQSSFQAGGDGGGVCLGSSTIPYAGGSGSNNITGSRQTSFSEQSKKSKFSKFYQRFKDKTKKIGFSFRRSSHPIIIQPMVPITGSSSQLYLPDSSSRISRVSSSIRYPTSVMEIYAGTNTNDPAERMSILNQRYSLARPRSILTGSTYNNNNDMNNSSFASMVDPDSDVIPIRRDSFVLSEADQLRRANSQLRRVATVIGPPGRYEYGSHASMVRRSRTLAARSMHMIEASSDAVVSLTGEISRADLEHIITREQEGQEQPLAEAEAQYQHQQPELLEDLSTSRESVNGASTSLEFDSNNLTCSSPDILSSSPILDGSQTGLLDGDISSTIPPSMIYHINSNTAGSLTTARRVPTTARVTNEDVEDLITVLNTPRPPVNTLINQEGNEMEDELGSSISSEGSYNSILVSPAYLHLDTNEASTTTTTTNTSNFILSPVRRRRR